jgi:hypothetical protein
MSGLLMLALQVSERWLLRHEECNPLYFWNKFIIIIKRGRYVVVLY